MPKVAVTTMHEPNPAQFRPVMPLSSISQASPVSGYRNGSIENTASMWYFCFSPREKPYCARSSLRTFFSSGSCSVRARSRISTLVGSIWPPAPPTTTSGILLALHQAISAALGLTLSIASTT